jgi:hypothetical protein
MTDLMRMGGLVPWVRKRLAEMEARSQGAAGSEIHAEAGGQG